MNEPPIGLLSQRPSDPIGISTSGLERTRRELRELDSRLDLWWDERKGLWKVMEMVLPGVWSYCFFWRGPNGEYRPPDAVDAMKRKLGDIDWNRQSVRDRDASDLREDISPRRKEILKAKAEEEAYLKKTLLRDYAKRAFGERTTVGPGKLGESRAGRTVADRILLREARAELDQKYQEMK